MANRKRLEDDPLLAMSPISSKKRRRCLTVEEKISLLDRLKTGERLMDLSRELEISDSTIRALLKCETSIRKYAEKCTKNEYHSVTYISKDKVLDKMEKALYAWHDNQRRQGTTLNQHVICAKARELYQQLKFHERVSVEINQDGQLDASEFKASRSWYLKFLKRYNLEYNTKPENGTLVSSYPATFAKLIQDADYQPHQVFNALEFSFQWKRMPNTSVISKTNKTFDRIACDRIGLLFCSNAQGNFHIKPMLINRSKISHIMRTSKLSELPVFLRTRDKQTNGLPKVAQSHFHDWLTQCFTPSVRNYLQIMEMPQRCLLLLNNDFKQMVLPAYDDSFLRLEFLPANAPQLVQPLKQSVLPIFQCKYLQRFFVHLLQSGEDITKDDLYKVWLKYSIADGIDIIYESLEDISTECWQSGWHHLWPGIGNESYCKTYLNDEIEQVINHGSKLLGDISFNDMKLYLKLEDDGTQSGTQPESAIVENQIYVNNCDSSVEDIFVQLADDDLSGKEELISICSEQGEQSEVDVDNDNLSEECDFNENEMNINGDTNDELVTEYKLSEDEAIVEYHQTEDLTIGEISPTNCIRASIPDNHMKTQKRHRDANAKVQVIDKAFELKRELLRTLEQLGANELFSTFNGDLNAIMQPYVEFRKNLLQPTIKDYFK